MADIDKSRYLNICIKCMAQGNNDIVSLKEIYFKKYTKIKLQLNGYLSRKF